MQLEINNLLFDDAHPKCGCTFSQTNGQNFAFVSALDLGMAHARLKKPIVSRYWGAWDVNHPKDSMKQILKTGGKWPQLPK